MFPSLPQGYRLMTCPANRRAHFNEVRGHRMPVRWQVDGNWTIAANSIQYWNWNFFTDPGPTGGPNQGPIVFRAIPKGISQGGNNTARNVLVTYDFAMCRGGPGDDHAPEVFYEFKIRNDSSVAVPFLIQFVKFSDLPLNT
jgi:hypothetical protein